MESQIRQNLARQLMETGSPSIGREVAVTGSAARGVADQDSDLELNFWSEKLPSKRERRDWLRRAGATDLSLDFDRIADGSVWSTFRFRGVWVEAGWQTIGDLQRNLRRVLVDSTTDHDLLMVAWMLKDAVPLRTSGLLSEWQRAVSSYPESLVERLITTAAAEWIWPHWVASHWAVIRRRESLALSGLLANDIRGVLRILFALDRRWEPDWKWARVEVPSLSIAPRFLGESIEAIVLSPEPRRRVEICLDLIQSTLDLAPGLAVVRRAQAAIRDEIARGKSAGDGNVRQE